jgi:hypothetical protein
LPAARISGTHFARLAFLSESLSTCLVRYIGHLPSAFCLVPNHQAAASCEAPAFRLQIASGRAREICRSLLLAPVRDLSPTQRSLRPIPQASSSCVGGLQRTSGPHPLLCLVSYSLADRPRAPSALGALAPRTSVRALGRVL